MQKLKFIQKAFSDALLENGEISFISSDHPTARLNVYRHNVISNMSNALSITFPGVWKLLGEECANSLAHAFCQSKSNFPRSGCLEGWGRGFPDFLSQRKELASVPYIRDYALYEWLKHISYGAEKTLYNIDYVLNNRPAKLPPDMFIFTSNFPIDKIQEVVDNPALDYADGAGPVFCVICRPVNKVVTTWVAEELYSLLSKAARVDC